MNGSEHLTENQLYDYFGDTLDKNTKHEIGRHLLQCDFCLKRMPKPSPEQFWAALMTENDVDERDADKTNFSAKEGFITRLLTPPKILVWSAGGLAIALIFTALIWSNMEKPLNQEREVAEVFKVRNLESDYKQDKNNVQIIVPSVSSLKPSNHSASAESNSVVVVAKPKELNLKNRESKLPDNSSRQNSVKRLLHGKKENISSTRGVSSKCSEENPVEMDFAANKEVIVFKWKKIPNALKYHLYISDDEEILIDEYETEQETTFILKKSLDPLRTYKWKIIVTLENGNMVIGDSRKFTVKDFQTDQKKTEKKGNSEIRCSAKG